MTKKILLIAITCISMNVSAEPDQLSNDQMYLRRLNFDQR